MDIAISNIVSDVFKYYYPEPITSVILESEANYNDFSREVKATCTDTVVNDFIKTPENFYYFMKLVVTTFEKAISLYKKEQNIDDKIIQFVCKGGNILRMVMSTFFRYYTVDDSNVAYDFYKDFFKRSDADFSIYINFLLIPDRREYLKIVKHMNYLSFRLQELIRQEIMNNIKIYDSYTSADVNTKKVIMINLLDKLNKMSVLTDENNTNYYGGKFVDVMNDGTYANGAGMNIHSQLKLNKISQVSSSNISQQNTVGKTTDKVIRFYKDPITNVVQTNKIEVYELSPIPHTIYIAGNTALQFEKEGGTLAIFDLVRSKINFALYFEKDSVQKQLNIGGELIDVSIPKKGATGLDTFFTSMINDKALLTYKLYHPNTDEFFEYKAYSMLELVDDLEHMLFRDTDNQPWVDPKYVKRLNRVLILYFINIISNNTPSQFVTFLEHLNIEINNNNLNIKDLQEHFINHEQLLIFHTFLKEYNTIISNAPDENTKITFVQAVQKNIAIFLNFLRNITKYKRRQEQTHPHPNNCSCKNCVSGVCQNVYNIDVQNVIDNATTDTFDIDKFKILNKYSFAEYYRTFPYHSQRLCTNFIFREFVKTTDNMYNLSKLIITTLEETIAVYITKQRENGIDIPYDAIKLVLKNGNVLNMIYSSFKNKYAPILTDELGKIYDENFQKTTIECVIYVDYKNYVVNSNYKKIIKHLNCIVWHLLKDIRTIIINNRVSYDSFSDAFTELKTKIIESVENTNNAKITVQTESSDKMFIIKNTDLTIYETGTNNNNISLYTTGGIHYEKNNNLINVDLTELGIEFKVNNDFVNGQLSKIIIPKIGHYDLEKVLLDYDTQFEKHIMCNSDNSDNFNFVSYSLDTIIRNYENLLFLLTNYQPLNDKKYVSRLNKLFMLYLIKYMTINSNPLEIAKEILSINDSITLNTINIKPGYLTENFVLLYNHIAAIYTKNQMKQLNDVIFSNITSQTNFLFGVIANNDEIKTYNGIHVGDNTVASANQSGGNCSI
jgi:hypothetical protein